MFKNRKLFKESINKAQSMFEDIKKDENKADFYEEKDKKLAHIEVNLTKCEIYDELSNDSELNPEIFEFIEKTFRFTNKRYSLELDVVFPSTMKEEEKEKIEKLIKSYYAVNIVKTNEEVKRHNIISLFLLLFGALIYIAYGLLMYFNVNFVFQGIMEIASWVFIWEAVDMFFLSNVETKIDRLKNVKIFNAKIVRRLPNINS